MNLVDKAVEQHQWYEGKKELASRFIPPGAKIVNFLDYHYDGHEEAIVVEADYRGTIIFEVRLFHTVNLAEIWCEDPENDNLWFYDDFEIEEEGF